MATRSTWERTRRRRLLPDTLDADARRRMERSLAVLSKALDSGASVYGISRGFGPLADYPADNDSHGHGLGLISHLSVGQGPDLDVATTQLMLELRLYGMTLGFSGIAPERWCELAHVVRSGFVPVVPSGGSVSASGDLIPLAHAAAAMSGRGWAWNIGASTPVKVPADVQLGRLGLKPIAWGAREALAFVNGTSASLASTLHNQATIREQCWISAALTGTIVELLKASAEPYDDVVVRARGGLPGHRLAARWIRSSITTPRDACTARRLQEPYSLRCAPQVIGGLLDVLDSSSVVLDREVAGCSDNPVISADGVFHAGNFYAITAALVSDQHAVLVHQLAFLAERQLAVLVDPVSNGGLAPLLAARPGATSGLAGVQIASTAFLAEIRQVCSPATTTPVPTNLHNQDVVPMALMSSLRTRNQLRLSSLVLGSLAVAVAQLAHTLRVPPGEDGGWFGRLLESVPGIEDDRPLSDEVRLCADMLHDVAAAQLGADRL